MTYGRTGHDFGTVLLFRQVYTSLADGVYTFYVAGEDEVGNKAATKTVRFQVYTDGNVQFGT